MSAYAPKHRRDHLYITAEKWAGGVRKRSYLSCQKKTKYSDRFNDFILYIYGIFGFCTKNGTKPVVVLFINKIFFAGSTLLEISVCRI